MIDGKLEYEVTADTKGFSGPLSGANASISKLGGGLKGLIGPAFALTGIAGGIAGIGKALKGAADLQSLSVSLDVLTGSAEAGAKILKDIRALGESTPYEFPALADGVKTMLSFGIATEQTLPLISMLGDIAGGDSEKLKGLSLVLGQVASAGKLTGGDLLQFINAGFNPLNIIAKKTGETMVELRKRMEDGGVSFDEVRGAMSAATSEGGQFFGMMDKQSKTTNGLLSTLKDNVNNVFIAIGQPINDALTPLLEGAIGTVKRIGTGLEAAVAIGQTAFQKGRFGELLGTALKVGAMEGVNTLVGGLKWAAQIPGRLISFQLKQVTRLFAGDFNEIFKGFATGMGQIIKGIGDVIRAGIGGPFNFIVATFQAGLQYAVQKVAEGLGKIPGLGKKLGLDGFTGQTLSELIADAMGASNPAVLQAAGEASIKEGLGSMGAAIKSKAAMAFDDIGEAFKGMEGFKSADVFDTTDLRSSLGNLARTLDPKAYSNLLGALNGAGDPIKDAADKVGAAITASAPATGSKSATAGEEAPGARKIRLFGAADSEQRRLGRMSEVDQKKLAAGGSRLGALSLSPSGLGGSGALAAAAADAGRGPSALASPKARGAAANAPKSMESRLVELLKLIEGNTQPLKQLATA